MTLSPASTPTRLAAQVYLVLLPLGHLVGVPVSGVGAMGSDVLLVLLLLVWGAELAVCPDARRAVRVLWDGEGASRRVLTGLLALTGLGVWVTASASWGLHPGYAMTKGVGLTALALAALALATSGLGWARAVDAWLVGTLLALAVSPICAALGSETVGFWGGSGVTGLPFRRPSGPFVHPNQFGDYLVVSGILLWGRWGELRGRARAAAAALGAVLTLTLAATLSTAWIGAGVAMAALGWAMVRRGSVGRGYALALLGAGVAGVTMLSVMVEADVRILGVPLSSNGIRPAIWGSALEAVAAAPLWGVGAAPYVAAAVDPLVGGDAMLWDAHNAVLSVWAQFGLVGLGLAGVGFLGMGAGLRRWRPASPASRRRTALVLVLLAVCVHAGFAANEEMRHIWLLFGVLGTTVGEGA